MFPHAPEFALRTAAMALSSRLPSLLSAALRTDLPQWQFVLRAWLVAPGVELALRTAGIKRTIGWIDWLPQDNQQPPPISVHDGTRLVRWACKLQPLARGACLTRSLVQYALHRRDGTPARFVIGVRKSAEQPASLGLDAHAWVQTPGAPSPEPAFVELLHREHLA